MHTSHHWYLVAWDPARDDWSTFRIDRVQGTPCTGAHFAPRPPPAVDLRAYVTGAMAGVHQQGEQARVVMAKTIPHPPPRCKRSTTRTASCSAAPASWTRWSTGSWRWTWSSMCWSRPCPRPPAPRRPTAPTPARR